VFSRPLGIAERDCECLAVPSEFPVKNRPPTIALSAMNFFNKSGTLPKLAEALDKLLRARADRKGLIHTNSYEMNCILTGALQTAGDGHRVITHEPGDADLPLNATAAILGRPFCARRR
jgi:hypothetical protein